MTQTAKFTFENLDPVHGKGRFSASEPPKKRTLTTSQIKEIEDLAFSAGLSAGEQAALSRIESRAEARLEQIFAQYSQLMSAVNQQVCLLRRQSAELALLIAKKLASALIAEKPTAEVEKLFLSCVANLNAEPRIVIRVNEDLVDILKKKIDHMARKTGYPGRVVLIGDPDSHSAECQIEWADGGVTYRSPQQLAIIDQMIAEYVSGAIPRECGGDELSLDPEFTDN